MVQTMTNQPQSFTITHKKLLSYDFRIKEIETDSGSLYKIQKQIFFLWINTSKKTFNDFQSSVEELRQIIKKSKKGIKYHYPDYLAQ